VPIAADLTSRSYAVSAQTDLNAPPRPGEVGETVKDALVELLRQWLATANLTARRRVETPQLQKYARGAADPYITTTKVIQDYNFQPERLPAIVVTAFSGTHERQNIGHPIVGVVTQPALLTSLAGPFVIARPLNDIWTITVPTGGNGTYTINDISVVISDGASASEVARRLRVAFSESYADLGYQITLDYLRAQLTIEFLDFTLAVSGNLTATQIQLNAIATPSTLSFRLTNPNGQSYYDTITPNPDDFLDPASVSASSLATALNRYAHYVTFEANSSNQLLVFPRPHHPDLHQLVSLDYWPLLSSGALRAAFGWGSSTTIGAGATLTNFVLEAPAQTFPATIVGRYLFLEDEIWQVASRVSSTELTLVPQITSYSGALAADLTLDWSAGTSGANTTPILRRSHMWRGTQMIGVLANDPQQAQELADLVTEWLAFRLEEQHYTIIGRGATDWSNPALNTEHWQILFGSEISYSAISDQTRDEKDKIYTYTISIPTTLIWYIDREASRLSTINNSLL